MLFEARCLRDVGTRRCTGAPGSEREGSAYDSPDSQGHPVLKDPAFRNALQRAIDSYLSGHPRPAVKDSGSSTGAIVGGIVGGLFIWRRKPRTEEE